MYDTIEIILRKLKDDRDVQNTRFTSSFLNNVRGILEDHGFETAKLFLLDKLKAKDTGLQAQTLLHKVIPLLEACDKIPTQPSIAAYIMR